MTAYRFSWLPSRAARERVSARESNLSTLDLGDRRTGAGRSRNNIAAFFNNGARARGWIGPGADNVAGNSDDVLIATGETVAQIQNRVLGVGVNSAPLYTAVPGYATFGVRAGLRKAPHEVVVDLENLNDENYRGISWGIDAPGVGVIGQVPDQVLSRKLFSARPTSTSVEARRSRSAAGRARAAMGSRPE